MGYKDIKLHDYQEFCKKFIIKNKKCALFLDMGYGKTLITLMSLIELNPTDPVLIIAPINVAKITWVEEIKKWKLPLAYESLILNEKGKKISRAKRHEKYLNVLKNPPKIYILNEELIIDLIEFYKKNKLPFPFKTIVIDELQSFKSYKSKRFKALKSVTPNVNRVIGLTGTPTPNSLMEIWPEMYLLDNGKRLGKNITTFREKYFNPGIIVNNYPVTWKIKEGSEKEIYRLIDDITMSIENPNLNLPELVISDIEIELDQKDKKLYKKFVKEQVIDFLIEEEKRKYQDQQFKIKNGENINKSEIILPEDVDNPKVTAANAAVLSNKLEQLASGTIYLDQEEEKEILLNNVKKPKEEKKERDYAIVHNKKIEMLEYMLNEINDNVIIAYWFRSELAEITKMLDKNKKDYTIFDGDLSVKEAWDKGEIPILLIQPRSARHGLNLQYGGHILIWYTLTFSSEAYMQTNARIYRQGQTKRSLIYRLITKGTRDIIKKNVLAKKRMSEEELIESVRKELDYFSK